MALDVDGNLWMNGSDASPLQIATGLESMAFGAGITSSGQLWTSANLVPSEPLPPLLKVVTNYTGSVLVLSEEGNVYAVFGDGTVHPFPVLQNIVDIASGNDGAICLDDQGVVRSISDVPGDPLITDVASIAAGQGPFVAIKTDGTAWMWGLTSRFWPEDPPDLPPDPVQLTW